MLASYREAIELYFKPGLGHLRLVDLRDHHFRDLATAMRKINTPAADGDLSDLLRRLLDARATRDGKRISTRPLTDARIRRILAVASSALGGLVPHTLPFNPASNVKAGKTRRRKPLLWTAAREAVQIRAQLARRHARHHPRPRPRTNPIYYPAPETL
jgi:hypothetical protein